MTNAGPHDHGEAPSQGGERAGATLQLEFGEPEDPCGLASPEAV